MIDTIILSGGGIKGISHIGFCKVIVKQYNIKHWIGCSAGALIAFMFVIGYTINEIEKIIINCDYNSLINFDSIKYSSLIQNKGFLDPINLENMFKGILYHKIGKYDISYRDLYMLTKIKLTTVTTNITKKRCEYWNYEFCPNFSVINGIMCSSNVPILFIPKKNKYNNDLYIDGAVTNNFPINIVKTNFLGHNLINVHWKTEIINNAKINISKKYYNIVEFFIDLILLISEKDVLMTDDQIKRTLNIISDVDTFDINISKEKRIELIKTSYETTLQWYNKINY